ncbi:Maf/Ham1 [Terfezia boudieri ATCC MYA-4762]|uniref:Maf/Ham1 n=1 Tax=Terfezia boudieri ATCC MYA-4762 TaxID=1051890 RepID=A0A3N4LDC5_9PEZI|nr:Maf/Ham1 [Terfezia boudieri ATCC MYA-4762]
MPQTLLFITGNANKLSVGSCRIAEPRFLDLPESQGSVEEVLTEKCRRATDIVGGPVLVDDTALGFNALKELPGVYIKKLEVLISLKRYFDKAAEAICTFVYCEGPGKRGFAVSVKTKGRIVPARGPGDFGWDAVFVV